MRGTRCLYSPARALRRVFLSDLTTINGGSSSYNGVLQPLSASLLLKAQQPTLRTCGAIATRPHQQQIRTYKGGKSNKSSDADPQIKRYVMNEKIPSQWVQVASTEPGASLPPPERLYDVLDTLDLSKQALIMVAPPQVPSISEEEEARVQADPYYRPPPVTPTPAICKIADVQAMAAAEAAAVQAARQRRLNTKELELGWAIAPNDLDHKLRRMRAFLESGMRVEVLIARKKGARKATAEEAEHLVERIREAVAEVPKANEVRKPNGEVGAVLQLVFQGPAGKRQKKQKGKKNKYGKGEEEEEEEEGGEEEGEEGDGEEGENRVEDVWRR